MPTKNKKFIGWIQTIVTTIITALILFALGFIYNYYKGVIEDIQLELKSQSKIINMLQIDMKMIQKDIVEHNNLITKNESETAIIERDLTKVDKELTAVDVRVKTIHGRE